MVLIVVFSRFPYVGANNMYIERRVRSVVGRAFGEVNVVTVYITGRAFTVTKYILPTTSLSKSIYSFECRHSDSRYVGRTILHLNERIRRHVPLHLLPPEARKDRPRRGRPPKCHATPIDTGKVAIEHHLTGLCKLKRSARLAALKESAVSTGNSTNHNTALRSSSSEYQSVIAKGLSMYVECANLYSDDCFSALSGARSRKNLNVLESVFIHVQCPDLCV